MIGSNSDCVLMFSGHIDKTLWFLFPLRCRSILKIVCHYKTLLCGVSQWAGESREVSLAFSHHANLVLKVGLDRDLQTVGDTLAVLPHVIDKETAKGCHAVTDGET